MNVPKSIFRQYDVRGLVGRELTPDFARALGRAFASVAWERLGRAPVIAVGRDNRPSGAAALAAACGAESPTPAARRWTWARCRRRRSTSPSPRSKTDGGVQVTGSHNPPGVQRLQDGARGRGVPRRRYPRALGDHRGRALAERAREARRTDSSVLRRYREGIVSRHQLERPVTVVVDCGNGVGSLIAVSTLAGARRRGHAALLRVGRHLPQPPSRSHGAREPARSPGGGAAHRRRARASRSTAMPTGSARWTRPARSSTAISSWSSSDATPCAASARGRRSSST